MPIYEFLCEACGRITEVMQKVSDPAPKACQECGSTQLAKLVSRSAFQLKGGGWYADLYASRKPAAATGGGGSPSPKPAGDAAAAGKAPAAAAAKPATGSSD